MAINKTGQLDLASNIAGQSIELEFQKTSGAKLSLSQLYSGGGIVPANTGNVPASGPIKFSNFYGASDSYQINYLIVAGGGSGTQTNKNAIGGNSTFNGLTAIGGDGCADALYVSVAGSGAGNEGSTVVVPGTPGQGNNGGLGNVTQNTGAAGGAGSSDGVGLNAVGNVPGNPGPATQWIDGNWYAEGGGSASSVANQAPSSGIHGGGKGAIYNGSTTETSQGGTNATGYGCGGGGAWELGGHGGGGAGGLLQGIIDIVPGTSFPITVGLGCPGFPSTGLATSSGSGSNGVVIISYISAKQLGQGGTVTSTGSGANTRWYHTFTTNGTYIA